MFAPVQKEPAALSQDTTTLCLFMTHRRALVNYASRIVGCRAQAEEVVQEAWLRFDEASRGRLLDDATGYLYRIVRNLALDGARRMTRESRIISIYGLVVSATMPSKNGLKQQFLLLSNKSRANSSASDC